MNKIIILLAGLLWSSNLSAVEYAWGFRPDIPLWKQYPTLTCFGTDAITIENRDIFESPIKASNIKMEIDFTKEIVYSVLVDSNNQNKEFTNIPKLPIKIIHKYHSFTEEFNFVFNIIYLDLGQTINFKITEKKIEAIRVSNSDPLNFKILIGNFNCM